MSKNSVPSVMATVLGLALVLTPSLARAGGGVAPAPDSLPDDYGAQKRTVADIRNAGTALFSWLTDQITEETEGDDSGPCGTMPANDKAVDAKQVDLYNIPEISREDLRKILVPQYLQELPRNDGWGNPYEFRLNLENLLCRQVMAIRSAGADGRFDSGIYPVSAFEPAEVDEDLVWSDGFFLRWPQATQADRKPVK